MKTEEFVPIAEDTIVELLCERYGYTTEGFYDGRRQAPRWPFPGTAELWVPDPDGGEAYILARVLNLCPTGAGILVDTALEVGEELSVALHEPEATLFGKGTVRHCASTEHGYHVGIEFVY